jgi:hypothetical protein
MKNLPECLKVCTKKYGPCFRHTLDWNQCCSNLVGFMTVLFNNSVRATGPHKEVHCKQYRIGNGAVSGTSSSYFSTQFGWYSLQFYLLIFFVFCAVFCLMFHFNWSQYFQKELSNTLTPASLIDPLIFCTLINDPASWLPVENWVSIFNMAYRLLLVHIHARSEHHTHINNGRQICGF